MATTQITTQPSERKPTTKLTHVGAPPPEQEHLPCPRCDSTNTKFCYYNNYNFSQPRHFCKSCRRYWTHGGTLRDIPIGGGTRKNAKRSRNNNNNNNPVTGNGNHPVFAMPLPGHVGFLETANHGVGVVNGSFTSLLSNGSQHGNNGFLGLSGFGPGIEDLGFGLGRSVWPFHGVVENGGTWQMENGHGFVGVSGNGECFTLPDLAISTHGSTMLK